MKAKITNLAINRNAEFQFLVTTKEDQWLEKYLMLEGKPVELDFRKWRNRRSDRQNAFFWVLIGKLADAHGTSPAEMYLKVLYRWGRHFDITLRPYDRKIFVERWQKAGQGNICELLAPSVGGSPELLRVWYGISDYTESQMKQLLNRLVAECELLGISLERPEPPEEKETGT